MDVPPGLRERRRLAAMRRIQTVALDLFEAEGFDQVTIEQIAEASEVSPSSVYRYFGTKESLVIWDEYDPAAIAAIVEALEDHGPVEAVRRVVTEVMLDAFESDAERVQRRLRLSYETPAIEAASALQAYEMAGLIAGVLAQGTGRPPDDLDVQVFAHAFVGGLLGALRHWYATGFTTDVREISERPLAVLEHGLRLGEPPRWDTAERSPPRRPPGEAEMASKDKGGKASKTAAALSPKDKKQAKRDKKAVKGQSAKDL